jgi:hypothetical protein
MYDETPESLCYMNQLNRMHRTRNQAEVFGTYVNAIACNCQQRDLF